ncbi:MAG: hypothetical protein KAS04_04685 [Candidatus Aenigmarchaeota archaeon]|nr:hypothetical protein [Candidatus Aenigmarchaeota archaeon]
MNKKGIMPLWATSIFGFLFLVIGAYLAITLFAVPLAFWSGIVLIIVGIIMIFITMVLK